MMNAGGILWSASNIILSFWHWKYISGNVMEDPVLVHNSFREFYALIWGLHKLCSNIQSSHVDQSYYTEE